MLLNTFSQNPKLQMHVGRDPFVIQASSQTRRDLMLIYIHHRVQYIVPYYMKSPTNYHQTGSGTSRT